MMSVAEQYRRFSYEYERPYVRPIQRQHRQNGLESKYGDLLSDMKKREEILDYRYEGLTFRITCDSTWTPDWLVVFRDRMELHEVKGDWAGGGQKVSNLKMKIAAKQYPWFRFVLAKWLKRKRIWIMDEVIPVMDNGEEAVAYD